MVVMQLPGVAPTTNRPRVIWEPIPAPQNVGPAPAGVGAIIGEFSRGLVDTPKWIGDTRQLQMKFGGVTRNPTDASKPLSGFISAWNVARQGVLDKYIVRVGSALLKTAYVTLLDGSSNPVLTLWAGSPGTWANGSLSVVVVAGVDGTHQSLIVTNAATGESTSFLQLPFGSAANVLSAIAQINARGGDLCYATLPVIDPTNGSPGTALSGTTSASGGTIPAGAWRGIGTYTNATGETVALPESAVVTTTGSTSTLTFSVSALPTGATNLKVYLTSNAGVSGTETYAATGAGSATSVTITAPPAASAVRPPTGPVGPGGTIVAMAPRTSPSTNVPAVGTFPMQATGASAAANYQQGNDGAGSNAARHTGAAGSPNLGLYSLTAVSPAPDYVLYAEAAAADSTEWLNQATLAQQNNWIAVACWPQGTTAEAVPALMATAQATLGAYAAYIKVAFNWAWTYEDTSFGADILVAPHTFLAGISCALDPNVAVYNKPLRGVRDTEWHLSDSQCQSLITANTDALVGDIPAGGWGFDSDLLADGSNGFEVRMQQYIALGMGGLLGAYVGEPNTPDTRRAARLDALTYLDSLARAGYIPQNPPTATTATTTPNVTTATSKTGAGIQPSAAAATAQSTAASPTLYWVVVCDSSNNVIDGVTTNQLFMDVQVQLAPNIRQAIIRGSVGTNVVVTLNPAPVDAAGLAA